MLDKVRGGGAPEKKWGGGPRSFAKICPFLAANSFCKEMKEKKGGIGAFLAAVVTSLYLGINKSLFFADRVFLFDWRAF